MANEKTQGLDASIAKTVEVNLQDYLDTLMQKMPDADPTNIYRLVVDEVERPMLEIMMRYTHSNQSRAAQCLGINRATLRTKLRRHNLL